MIIVTTTYTPEAFCNACNGEELNAEDARQLYRRINAVYECTHEDVYEYEYDETSTHREKNAPMALTCG